MPLTSPHLVPISEPLQCSGMPYDRFQMFAKCSAATLKALQKLSNDPQTTVVVLTSRNRSLCDAVLGNNPVWVGAENGIFLKRGSGAEWENLQVRFVR